MDKKIYWLLTGILFIISAFFLGYLVYSNLDKGLVMNDEAYYLMHFRDFREIITVDATNYFRIFQLFYTDNIYHFRVITLVLLNASSFLLFALAARYYQLKIHPVLFGFLGICLNFLSWQGTIIVLNQYHGNTILMNLSLSFLLLFLLYRKSFFVVISGAILGILFFDGIPHSIAIGPVALFILYNFWKENKRIVYLFFGGILLGLAFYFIFIEDFSTYIAQFEYLKIYKSFHRKQHPIRFYFYWFALVIGFIFIPLSMLLYFFHKKVSNKKVVLDKLLLFLGFVLVVTAFFFQNLHLLYVFLGLLIYRFTLEEPSNKEITFLLILFLIPFGLAFGSGFYFHIRAGMYQIYFFLCLNIILLRLYSIKSYFLFLVFFIGILLNYPKFLNEKGWKDFIYTEQNIPVQINGHTLYLDKKTNKDIEDLRPYLQNQQKVIYSSNHLMGYLYILNAKPPVPYYFTLKNYIQYYIEKNGDQPDDYIYIESNDYPFSVKEIVPLKFVKHPENYEIVKAGRFTIYLPQNFQKK